MKNMCRINYLCTYDLYGPVCNCFDAGKLGYWKECPENQEFLGPEMASSRLASAIWAPKTQDFQGPPLPMYVFLWT
jgi:hypothetical protein